MQDTQTWSDGFGPDSVDGEGEGKERSPPYRAGSKSASASLDLSLSVREAKSSLSKNEYKEWKRLKAKETTSKWDRDNDDE